jgi:hypothetical protein
MGRAGGGVDTHDWLPGAGAATSGRECIHPLINALGRKNGRARLQRRHPIPPGIMRVVEPGVAPSRVAGAPRIGSRTPSRLAPPVRRCA